MNQAALVIGAVSNLNPYRDWLGLTETTKPTYYQLLGVSPSESDNDVIRQRAVLLLRKLAAVQEPSHQRQKKALVLRIKRAAKCLMQPKLRAQYDQQLVEALQAEQPIRPEFELPSHSHLSSHLSSAASDTPAGDADGRNQPIAIDAEAKTPKTISTRYKSQRQRTHTILLCGLLGIVSLAGIAFLGLTQTEWGRALVGTNQTDPIRAPDTGFDDDVEPLPMEEDKNFVDPAKRDPDLTEPTVMSRDDGAGDGAGPSTDRQPPSQLTPEPTADEISSVSAALQAARSALGRGETDLARQGLNDVRSTTMRNDDRAKYDRLVLLTGYVESYWQATEDGWQKLKGGNELRIREQRVMIVEVDSQQMIVRRNGRNQNWRRDELPTELRVALAESWFNQSAASTKVFRGAMMAVTPGYEPAKARELWRQAREAGADIADLEMVLDDQYDLEP